MSNINPAPIIYVASPCFSLPIAFRIDEEIWQTPNGKRRMLPIVSNSPATASLNKIIPIGLPSINKIGVKMNDIIIE